MFKEIWSVNLPQMIGARLSTLKTEVLHPETGTAPYLYSTNFLRYPVNVPQLLPFCWEVSSLSIPFHFLVSRLRPATSFPIGVNFRDGFWGGADVCPWGLEWDCQLCFFLALCCMFKGLCNLVYPFSALFSLALFCSLCSVCQSCTPDLMLCFPLSLLFPGHFPGGHKYLQIWSARPPPLRYQGVYSLRQNPTACTGGDRE